MNKTAAFILTLFIDFCVLLAGSGLIVLLNVGGIIIMLIEFYCIKSIHKAVYGWLIGLGKDNSNINDEIATDTENAEAPIQVSTTSDEHVVSEEKNDVEPQEEPAETVVEKAADVKPSVEEISVADLFEKSDKVLVTEEEAMNLPYELDIEDLVGTNGEKGKPEDKQKVPEPKDHETNNNGIKYLVAFLVILVLIISVIFGVKGCSTESNTTTPPPPIDTIEVDFNGEVTQPASYENDEERWDAESCVYANFRNGVAFRLPNDIPWHKVGGIAKHTVVRFIQPNTDLTLYVNLQEMTNWPADANGEDIWEYYDLFTQQVFPEGMRMTEANSSEKILDYSFNKTEICGKHSIKTEYHSMITDSRIDGELKYITIEYSFLYRRCLYTVTMKCFEEIKTGLAEEGIDVEDFLQCFILTPIDE